jgi:hypothetical protein
MKEQKLIAETQDTTWIWIVQPILKVDLVLCMFCKWIEELGSNNDLTQIQFICCEVQLN